MIESPARLHLQDDRGRYAGTLVVVSWRWSQVSWLPFGVPGGPVPGAHRIYTVRHAGCRRTWEVAEGDLRGVRGG